MPLTGGRLKLCCVAEARKTHREKRLLSPPGARASCQWELTFYRRAIHMAQCHDGGGKVLRLFFMFLFLSPLAIICTPEMLSF